MNQIIDYSEDIDRGKIFRRKGKYPYEEVVDFMVATLNASCRGCVDIGKWRSGMD